MNLELELEDDDSEDDARLHKDREFRVQVAGKKLSKVPAKGRSKQNKPAPSNALDSINAGSKRSPNPKSQQNVFESFFISTLQAPEPQAGLSLQTHRRLPERQPFANAFSNQSDWAANRLAEDDTCHTNMHGSKGPLEDPVASMQPELAGKACPKLRSSMIVEVSVTDSATAAEDKTSAMLSEVLQELANKLSRSRTDKLSRSLALQELSEFVYKCENTEIDADVITRTRLGCYLQLMYRMILEFSSSDSPEYDNLIPRTSKLITNYKRILSEQVLVPHAVQARREALRHLQPAFFPAGRPRLGQELQPGICFCEGRVPVECAGPSSQHRERSDRPESRITHRGVLSRLGPGASSHDGQRRRRLHARQPAEESDQENLPAPQRRPARRSRRRPRHLNEDREVREQNLPIDRLCH
jgi:hypothetical protein